MANEQKMGFWDKLKHLFSQPSYFFQYVKTEQSVWPALWMLIIAAIFASALKFTLSMVIASVLSLGWSQMGMMGFFFGVWSNFLLPAFAIMGIAIYAALVSIIILIFGAEGGYKESFKVLSYSSVPSVVLSSIPLVGFLGGIYALFLMIVGLSEVHNISKGKAALAAILPGVLICGALVIVALYILSTSGF